MKKFIIYDDFYTDPEAIRTLALDMTYHEPNTANYPGTNSDLSYFSQDMGEFFSWLAGDRIQPAQGSACGHFRKTVESDISRQHIHVDLPSLNVCWAGILYLNPNDQVLDPDGSWRDSGTKFWRHRRLGMDSLPTAPAQAQALGFNSLEDVKRFMDTEGLDESLWHETMRVPPAFNRLVLFRPLLWHSIGRQFGVGSNDCRLTQLFFFEPAV